jgi:hypothetical protein
MLGTGSLARWESSVSVSLASGDIKQIVILSVLRRKKG